MTRLTTNRRVGAAVAAAGIWLAGPMAMGLGCADADTDGSVGPGSEDIAATSVRAARPVSGPRSRTVGLGTRQGIAPASGGNHRPRPAAVSGRHATDVSMLRPPPVKAPTAKAGNVPAAVVLSTEVMPAATAPLPLGVTPLGTIAADGAPVPRMAAAEATPSPSITALQIRIAHFIDGVGSWLSGLPTNPITEFAAGALLLLRRALFPAIPPIEAVTTGQVYGGYVLRTPDNPPAAGLSDDVIEAAQRIRADAAAAEPEVTRDMIDFANAHGGRMEGLDFRLKSEQSLARKIADRVQSNGGDPWVEAQKLSDVTRYTMTFPTAIYAQSVAQTVADLSLLGYQLRIKNYWQQGDPYQGINVALTAPTGQKIELQFHTPESLAVKEGDLHKLYEIFRESQDNDERWRTYLAMTALAMTIPMPSYQVLAITALEFQPFEILQTVSVSLGEDSLITLLAAA